MKKIVSLMLLSVMLLTGLLPCSQLLTSAALVTPSQFGGINNVMLMYTFANQGAVSGRHTVETLLPYVGYYDTNGKLQSMFFDSFLLLPCVTKGPSGGSMYLSSNPAIASDWQAYIDDVFVSGYNLDALNTAVGKVKKELGKSDYKAKIFFTLIYPASGQTNFGTIGGRKYDFSKLQDRIDICKWQVDNYISLFKKGNYENLELYGFYWFEEFINTKDSAEKTLLTTSTDYMRSKGYKSVWIPYYMAQGWNKWKEYGFDIACLQPNYMFNANAESDRIKNAVSYASQYNMCNEMEASSKIISSADYYNRYLTYLRDFASQGAMNAVKMYYQDVKFYYSCYESTVPEIRLLYDLTYKYAMGTLKESDFDGKYIESTDVKDRYSLVSLGCNYTATAAYTDSNSGYANVSGKELTDGEYYSSEYGTEWHAFHRGTQEKDGGHQVVLDLGTVYDNLNYIYMEFRDDAGASIGLPKSVKFYTSVDGKDYTLLTETQPAGAIIGCPAAKYEGKDFRARYIKAVFPTSSRSFVFVSELAVGSKYVNPSMGEKDYDIISTGCEYTAFRPFTDLSEWDAPYKHISGKELTDGILGTEDHVGTEWYDMYNGYLEEGEKFWINIDLGAKWNDLRFFGIQFCHDLGYGIAAPNNVTYFVSDDGVNFKQVGTVAVLTGEDGFAYASFASANDISGRYVRAEFESGHCVHNFLSEFTVGVTKGSAPAPDEDDDVIGEYTLGDINDNGKITLTDYLMARRIAANKLEVSKTAFAAADINGDSVIDQKDYTAVKNKILNGSF